MYLKGSTWSSLKKNPSLLPLFFFVGFGVIGGVGYLTRVVLKSPDVSFRKKANPEPWNYYKDKQYKFYSPKLTEEHLKPKIPEY